MSQTYPSKLGTWSASDGSKTARVCRFCGHFPVELTDWLGRDECADTQACQAREFVAGLTPHNARYAKGPPRDPDGPVCICGRRVFDPIHRDGWAASVRVARDARLANL